MPLSAGTRLGPYEVATKIGEGGMGEVYRATDTNLKRAVALKVLPAAVASDPDRLARFQREAEVLASLNHPNIAQIHGLERANGTTALVMELVEGPTLADRIAQGAIAIDEALPIAKQLAEALEAAHERGIIHRDLKPANIKVRPDGTVKVLDFGLAKAMEPAGVAHPGVSQMPTITTPAMTQAGMILGTAAYMSPEQVKGRPADRRADVWAFGGVLFEMLTGRRAFAGDDVADTMAAVLMKEPDWALLPATTPPPIRALLEGCLRKDARQRFANVSVVRFLLDDKAASLVAAPPVSANAHAASGRLAWGVAALAGIGAVVLGAMHYTGPPPPAPVTHRFAVTPAFPTRLATDVSAGVALSPDGRHLLLTVTPGRGVGGRLAIRALDEDILRELPGTDGAGLPFWAPDSRGIAFFVAGQLKRTDVDGAPPQVVSEAPLPQGGTWNRDGTILFGSTAGGISRVAAAGGRPEPVTALDGANKESSHRHPVFLPDGRRFLYVVTAAGRESAVYAGSLDGGLKTRLVDSDSNASFMDGHLLFSRDGTLLAQAFDSERLVVTGDPRPLAQGVWSNAQASTALFSGSATGTLAFRSLGESPKTQLTWVDEGGRALGTVGEPGDYTNLELSPDGRRVVFSAFDAAPQTRDLWVHDLSRNVRTRFTFGADEDLMAVWSPDGTRLAYSSARTGVADIFERAADGSGEERMLVESGDNKYPTSWSADGQLILFTTGNARSKTGNDIWVLEADGQTAPRVLLQTQFNEQGVRLSPDGRWILYQSSESGRNEVYISPRAGGGGKWQVSAAGGADPRWRHDGRHVYYVANGGTTLMGVSVDLRGTSPQVGSPQKLFEARFRTENYRGYGVGHVFDVSPDGKRFLVNLLGAEPATPSSVTVVTNWTSLLR